MQQPEGTETAGRRPVLPDLLLLFLFFFFNFLATQYGMPDLSSPTRDQVCAPCGGGTES